MGMTQVENENAANLFMVLKQPDRAMECYTQAYEAHSAGRCARCIGCGLHFLHFCRTVA